LILSLARRATGDREKFVSLSVLSDELLFLLMVRIAELQRDNLITILFALGESSYKTFPEVFKGTNKLALYVCGLSET
jgi:hypothetical protein